MRFAESDNAPPQSGDIWLEARFRALDSLAARELSRLLRKRGAAHVWQQAVQVWSLWPDTSESRETLTLLGDDLELPPTQTRRFRAQDPLIAWRDPQPQAMGPNLAMAPAWMGLSASKELMVLEAGTAFGAGDHPSTWLNLNLICRHLAGEMGAAPPAGAWAADVGSGSGVLALGMALAGGLRVLALDPDPAARRAMTHNLGLNPLAAPLVHFAQATHEALAGRFELIAANLPGPILKRAGPAMAKCLSPGAGLIISGFRVEAGPEMATFFGELGLEMRQQADGQGWLAMLLARL